MRYLLHIRQADDGYLVLAVQNASLAPLADNSKPLSKILYPPRTWPVFMSTTSQCGEVTDDHQIVGSALDR